MRPFARYFSIVSLSVAFLLPVAAWGDPAVEPGSPTTQLLEVDWEASRDLVFFALPDEYLVSGVNKARVRITEGASPWFSEHLMFDPRNAELPAVSVKALESDTGLMSIEPPFVYALELLARNPDEVAELLAAVRAGGRFRAEIQLNGHLLFRGSMLDLVKASDELRSRRVLPLPSTSKFVDRRPGKPSEGQLVEKQTCEGLCLSEYQDCVVEFCDGELIGDECQIDCEAEYQQCVDNCDPEPPQCTPGLISTNTYSELVSAQYAGWACYNGIFNYGDQYNRYYLTFKQSTYNTYRQADCSTYTVLASVTYVSDYCYTNTYLSCSFPFGFPFCVFY